MIVALLFMAIWVVPVVVVILHPLGWTVLVATLWITCPLTKKLADDFPRSWFGRMFWKLYYIRQGPLK